MKVPDHRGPLREKYQSFGESALDDFDILELLLLRSNPQRDTSSSQGDHSGSVAASGK